MIIEEEKPELPPDKLEELIELVKRQLSQEKLIANLEKDLDDAKQGLNRLSISMIPDLFKSLGLEQIKVNVEGINYVVTLDQSVAISIPKENRDEAFEWLSERGYGGMIKNKVVATFSMGEDDIATKCAEKLREEGFEVEIDKQVHPQTLKAWAKEVLADGVSIPDAFSCWPYSKSKVQLIKPKRGRYGKES